MNVLLKLLIIISFYSITLDGAQPAIHLLNPADQDVVQQLAKLHCDEDVALRESRIVSGFNRDNIPYSNSLIFQLHTMNLLSNYMYKLSGHLKYSDYGSVEEVCDGYYRRAKEYLSLFPSQLCWFVEPCCQYYRRIREDETLSFQARALFHMQCVNLLPSKIYGHFFPEDVPCMYDGIRKLMRSVQYIKNEHLLERAIEHGLKPIAFHMCNDSRYRDISAESVRENIGRMDLPPRSVAIFHTHILPVISRG